MVELASVLERTLVSSDSYPSTLRTLLNTAGSTTGMPWTTPADCALRAGIGPAWQSMLQFY
jgi:hypothetical protein